MEGETFAESDYGLLVSNTPKIIELEQAIKQYAQAFIQNGGSMTTIMDIYFSPSLMDMRRKLEIAEEQMQQNQSQQAQEANKTQQEANTAMVELENRKLKLEDLKNQRDNETKRYIAELGNDNDKDGIVDDGIGDPLDQEKFQFDINKARADYNLKLKVLDQDMIKHKDDVELKKESNQISRIKKKTTA